jgi:hypothetical protein
VIKKTKDQMKEVLKEVSYWNDFYLKRFDSIELSIPSQFCSLMATEIDLKSAVADFGCGNGRDAIFFGKARFSCSGYGSV